MPTSISPLSHSRLTHIASAKNTPRSSLTSGSSEVQSESTWVDDEGAVESTRVCSGGENFRKRLSLTPIIPHSLFERKDRPISSADVRPGHTLNAPNSAPRSHKRPLLVRIDKAASYVLRCLAQVPRVSRSSKRTASTPASDPFGTKSSFFAFPSVTISEDDSFLHLSTPTTSRFSFARKPSILSLKSKSGPARPF